MHSKNLWIILSALLLILFIALAGLLIPWREARLPAPLFSPAPQTGEQPAPKGYVFVAAGDQSKWFALPEEERAFTIRQTRGEETVENTLCLTPQGVYMKLATCDNQDCVRQGAVTLENRDSRPLGNRIICLPHDVVVELYTAEEILAAQAGQSAP